MPKKGTRFIVLDKELLVKAPKLKNVIFVFDHFSYGWCINQYWFTYYRGREEYDGWFAEKDFLKMTNYDDLLINLNKIIKSLA